MSKLFKAEMTKAAKTTKSLVKNANQIEDEDDEEELESLRKFWTAKKQSCYREVPYQISKIIISIS